MGYADREYRMPVDFAVRITPAVKWILIACVAVYGLQLVCAFARPGAIENLLGFKPARAVGDLWLWQFVTGGFLHDTRSLWHILLNLLILWFVGPELERLYGTRRFLILYFGSIAFAHLCYAVVHFSAHPFTNVIGASGAITGLLVLFAIHFPDAKVWFFFLFPIPARIAVLILLAMDLHAMIVSQPDGIAHAAHLGGALFAFCYRRWHPWFEERLHFVDRFFDRHDLRREFREETRDRAMEEEMNRILEKISREGIQNLAPEERALLERVSARYRRKSP